MSRLRDAGGRQLRTAKGAPLFTGAPSARSYGSILIQNSPASYLTLPATLPQLDPFTVSLWVNTFESAASVIQSFFRRFGPTFATWQGGIDTSASPFHACLRVNSINQDASDTWNLGQWYCWQVRRSADSHRLFVNGVLQFDYSQTEVADPPATEDRIGSGGRSSFAWFRCWNAGLSDAELLSEYLAGPNVVRLANLYDAWTLNGVGDLTGQLGKVLTAVGSPVSNTDGPTAPVRLGVAGRRTFGRLGTRSGSRHVTV